MTILNFRKKTENFVLAITLGSGVFLAVNPACADPGIYIGAGYGISRVDNADFSDNKAVMKAFVGGKFNDYIGIEGAINDFGEVDNAVYSSSLKGNSAALLGYLPLTESFDLYIKGGQLWWSDKVTVLNTYEDTIKGNELFYGLGANFHFNKMISMRAEIERYKVELNAEEIGVNIDNSTDVDVASLGIAFGY